MSEKNKKTRINCRKCRHFFVTWDSSRPYGCRHFAFKSHQIPSIDVRSSSGSPCMAFQEKNFPEKFPQN